jgi:hypothetical protein
MIIAARSLAWLDVIDTTHKSVHRIVSCADQPTTQIPAGAFFVRIVVFNV